MKSHHAALLLLGFFALGTEPILANLRKKLGKMEAHDKPPARSMATFQDLCLFPPEEGDCKANIPRFFFNSTSWKCEGFIYGGCGGNDNNFKTREECLQFCSHRELLQPGDCPRRMLPGLSRPTEAYCIEDGTCPGEQKCCLMGNIRKCVLPVGVNPGFCPRRDDATVFTEPCSFDLDCALDEKCCPSEGRRRCTKALPANPGFCPKKSLLRVPSPCEGECIDDQSCPKGKKCCFVNCGLKCVPPESHHSGERVELDRDPSLEVGHRDICLLPPKQGDCDAHMPRFFYNSTSGKCEKFIFGGCGGNENNFMTREECYHACIDRALSKPGICPRRTVPALPRSSKAYCAYDVSCPGDQKCCHIGNIKRCALPVGVHPGYCPRRDDVAVSSKHCSWDSDCAVDEKCCPSEEHKRCTKAIPANRGLCPKRSLPLEFFPCEGHCRDDRSCSKGQKCCFVGCGLQCVPPETHHSVERVALDQDHALTLPVHRGSWPLNSTERESHPARDFCHLPSASGSCDAPSVHRVFYNSQARRCERFLYKGCGGNRNNFATQLECLRSCSNPGICQLPMDHGIGDALRPRYFYNSDSRTCEHFIYRGHHGNANNFWEEEDCLQFCGSHAA